MKAKTALALTICAGCAISAQATDLSNSVVTSKGVVNGMTGAGLKAPQAGAHIYLNPKTGEMVINRPTDKPQNGTSGGRVGVRTDVDGDGIDDVWMATDFDPCTPDRQDSFDDNGGNFDLAIFGIDFPPTTIGDTYLFTGDVAPDSVVGTVSFSWFTDAPGIDSDGDGQIDTSADHGMAVGFYDGDDGFGDFSNRVLVGGFNFIGLAGDDDSNDPLDELVTVYLYTIDLTALTIDTDSDGTPDGDFTFELGDSDGQSTATFFNPLIFSDSSTYAGGLFNGDGLPDTDIDGDGLHDFGAAFGVNQGTDAPATAGCALAAPTGTVAVRADRPSPYDNYHNIFSPAVAAPEALGTFQAFDLLAGAAQPGFPQNVGTGAPGADYTAVGTFAFIAFDPATGARITDPRDGSSIFGFNCDLPAQYIADGGNVTTAPNPPYTQAYLGLSGVGSSVDPCDVIDLDGDGIIGFGDVSAFATAFTGGNLAADIDGDGIVGFGDVSAFATLFTQCQ